MSFEAEEWRSVVGWDGLYSVSNLGRVRSEPRGVPAVSGIPRRLPGRMLQGSVTRYGYRRVHLCRENAGVDVHVHQLVLEAFVGPRPAGGETRHLDGDKRNNRLTNLVWGTHDENQDDKFRHGTAQPLARLTPAQVREIRARLAAGESARSLSAAFGVVRSQIYHIKTGRCWSRL